MRFRRQGRKSGKVSRKARDAAHEYRRGETEAARKELGDLAFDALGTVFPEAQQARTKKRSGGGFVAGVLVGAALVLWLVRRKGDAGDSSEQYT